MSLQYYGYVHVNGNLFIRRFFGDVGDIQEAAASDFVQLVIGPFEADNMTDAMAVFKKLLQIEKMNQDYGRDGAGPDLKKEI